MNYEELALTQRLEPSALLATRSYIGGGGGSSSSKFSRKGTGVHQRTYQIPSDINSLVTNAAKGATTDPSLATNQITLFNNLMQGA